MNARRPSPISPASTISPASPAGPPHRPGLRRRDFGRLALGLALTGAACQSRRSYYAVDYYFIPYCMSCTKVKAAVTGFPSEFGDRVRVRTIECDTPAGKAAAKKYGFQSHGLVIFDRRGELLFVRRDHRVDSREVHAVLARALAASPA